MRISGIDIDGWRDFAARDWDPEEPDGRLKEPILVQGGVGTVAVCQKNQSWVGGPQAALAPHGRGRGWGNTVGSLDRRIRTTDSLATYLGAHSTPETIASARAALIGTFDAMSRGAETTVLAIPDVAEMDEAARDLLIQAFAARRRSVRLLWRPVACFLEAISEGVITEADEGRRFAILVHSADGFEVQALRLRADSEHRDHLAPERDGYGVRIGCELGLEAIEARADAHVLAANDVLKVEQRERRRFGLELALGAISGGTEQILRRDNGNWIKATMPSLDDEALLPLQHIDDLVRKLKEWNSQADAELSGYLLSTPLADGFAGRLTSLLSAHLDPLHRLSEGSAAKGALRAGRLIATGLPHYFDRLTPVALAIRGGDGEPRFHDLIDADATLPANREYVSPPFRELQWSRGKGEIEFYVRKGAAEMRHWKVVVATPPGNDERVALQLRQTPGQSWARLTLNSDAWDELKRNPVHLDWANLHPIELTAEQVLEKLRSPPPVIPTRVVEQASILFWVGAARYPGITPLFKKRGEKDPALVAKLLDDLFRDKSLTHRPVGTDGALPSDLEPEIKEAFDSFIEACAARVEEAVRRRKPLDTNADIRCLTWIFARCPDSIMDILVAALQAHADGNSHVLLAPTAAATVVIQGAGRAVTGHTRLKSVLRLLVRLPANNNSLNALAMILSRRSEAPRALSAELVERIANLALEDLTRLAKTEDFSLRFKNGLSALAGLFRYREVEPRALLAGSDPFAEKMLLRVMELEAIVNKPRRGVVNAGRRRETIVSLLAEVQQLLKGKGTTNILEWIEGLE